MKARRWAPQELASPASPVSIASRASDGEALALARSMLVAAAAACTLLVAEQAGASDPPAASSPQAVIETRQAGFKKMGAAMKAIAEQFKSATPDEARIAEAAQAIISGASLQLQWFPAGTGPEAGVDTDALPHIWEDRAKFDSIANKLVVATKTLQTVVAGGDLEAIRAQVKTVGEVCKSCHQSFRQD